MENKRGFIMRNGTCIGMDVQRVFSTCPLGTVLSFAGQTAPRGFLLCDGASYKVKDYTDLYAVIGNTYGGDTENFNVPDYRETVLVGVGENTTDTIADHDVYELGEFKDDQLQDHTHTIRTGTNADGQNITQNNAYSGATWSTYSSTIKDGRKGTTTHGKQKGVTYIIKAFHTNEGMDSGVSDDVVEYVDNKFSSVDIKTTVTIPVGQHLKIELGENKLSTVLLSMKTTIGTGYTTFLISNYGIGTDARCRVQQLQGERKFAKYIDGCNLYITPSVADQVWYASAISVQGVNPVLSASETYSGTEITTNSVPKEIVDGLIKDTSSTTSTYSSAKIDKKFAQRHFGTDNKTLYLKLQLGTMTTHEPITVTDQYGGQIEILGMYDLSTYKSVKVIRLSYGDWTTHSGTDFTNTSSGDANYKIRRLFYCPDDNNYYLEIRQYSYISVEGAPDATMVTNLPVDVSEMTLIPESQFASKSDLATQTANRQVKTLNNTSSSTEKWYKICSALTVGIGCNIKLTASRADSTATVQYFSALFRDNRYRYTSTSLTRERTVYESELVAEYSTYIVADANNDIWVHAPSYGKVIIEIDTRAITIDGTVGTPVKDYVYNSFDHRFDERINDSATNTISTWSSSKIASTMPTTRSLTLKSGYSGYITEVYDPTTKVVVYNVNVFGTFKGLLNSVADGFKIPKGSTSSSDVMHKTIGIYGSNSAMTGDAQFTRLLVRNYGNPHLEVDVNAENTIVSGTITYVTA